MLAELGAVRSGLGDDERFRYAALVAEWGLGYFRGERAAAAGVAKAMGDCPDAADGGRGRRAGLRVRRCPSSRGRHPS